MAYNTQTNPGGSTAFRGAGADAFGAGIGKGVQQMGAVVEQAGARQKAADRDAENAAAGLEFARIANEIDTAEIDGRDKAAPGGAGHSETIAKLSDDRISKAIGNIKDPKIQAAYKARYEDLRGNVFNRAYGWERAAHTTKMVNDVGETKRMLANGQRLNPDAAGLQVSIDTMRTVWKNLDVAADVQDKGFRSDANELAYSYAAAMVDKDPGAIIGSKDVPSILEPLSEYLDDKQIGQLQNAAQAEQARLDAKARQAASQWEAKRRDEIGAIGKRITSLTDDTVTDEELDAAAADATKMGDKTLELDVANWRDLRDVRKSTRDWTPATWKAEIGKLEAKGDKLTSGENMRLTHLRQLRPAAEAKFNNSPDEWGNQNGDPMPAIDWENPTPAQGEARAAWSKRIEKLGGKPALLDKAELQRFQQRAGEGAAGQLAVAQTLRATFGVGRGSLNAIDQIGGDKPMLKLMLGLSANTAKDLVVGADVLKSGGVKLNTDVVSETWNEYKLAVPEDAQGAVLAAARNIAATELNRSPGEENEKAQAETFRRALHRAVGATGTNGGFVEWGENKLLIPPELEKGEAIRRLSRVQAPGLIAAAGGEPPYYLAGDGTMKRMEGRAIDLLSTGRLEGTATPGIYRVVFADGGHALTKGRGFWQFDIRKIK